MAPRSRYAGPGNRRRQDFNAFLEDFRGRLLSHYLTAYGGNVAAIARALGITRLKLVALLREHGLRPRRWARAAHIDSPACPCARCRGARGGRRTSEAKTAAVRANSRRGGRPRGEVSA